MTKADKTFRDLGQLYDFYQEIRKARLRSPADSTQAAETAESQDGDQRGSLPRRTGSD
jgi:hypothetical protein